MERLAIFKPTHKSEWKFTALIVLVDIIGFFLLPSFAAGSWFTAIVGAWLISSISMQLVARIWEKGFMFPPKTQYVAFFWGDLLCLPLIAALFTVLRDHQSQPVTSFVGTVWPTLCFIASLAATVGFRIVDAKLKGYSLAVLHSPTKLWHDYVSTPLYVFYLLLPLPLLFSSDWGLRSLAHERPGGWVTLVIFFAAAGLFGWMVVYDGRHPKPKAHFGYDWEHKRTAQTSQLVGVGGS